MKLPNKLQTLLTDLRDKALRRKYHIKCQQCSWQAHNLEHRRYADRRGHLHMGTTHQTESVTAFWNGTPQPRFKVWHTRA